MIQILTIRNSKPRMGQLSQIKSLRRQVNERGISASITYISESEKVHGRCELDSHADTIVAGANCVVLTYTNNSCDVMPYSDEYEPMKSVPIVKAATGYTSSNGRNYIIVFNEALHMPKLNHSLINPNQLRHYQTIVVDNPYDPEGMRIESPDGSLVMSLKSKGTTVYFDTWTPTLDDLESLPHIVLTSPHVWNPQEVEFPSVEYSRQEEIEKRSISQILTFSDEINTSMVDHEEDIVGSSMNRRMIKACKVSNIDVKDQFQGTGRSVQVIPEDELYPRKTFISKDRHSLATPEDLSERWGISIPQAAMTLKATTRRLVRSAIMPLTRRYRVDRMFECNRIRGNIATDTMHMYVKSIHGHRYAQVFGNKQFFVDCYPIQRKSDCGDALEAFIDKYGVPDLLTYDGSKEQVKRGTSFQKCIRKYNVKGKISEPNRPNQNPAEGVIRELRKKWFRTMFKTNCPRRLWCYGLPYIAQIMQRTASNSGNLGGRTPIETLTGETPDISEYMDFGFYDWVVFKEDAGVSNATIGRFLGIASGIGSLMSYWVLPPTGIPEVRSTVQRLTQLEMQTDAMKQRMIDYESKIKATCGDDDFIADDNGLPKREKVGDLIDDPDFVDEFYRTFSNEAVIDEDDCSPDSFDPYLNVELSLDRGGETPEFARVTKRLRDNNGIPIGRGSYNPILDTRLYEVEYLDGHKANLSANIIAENMYAQVDEHGHREVLFDEITDVRSNNEAIKPEDAFYTTPNGVEKRKHTTKGWEVMIRWKDGSTTWNTLKDVKDSFPLQLAEYAMQHDLVEFPAFKWWVEFVINRRKRSLSKVKSKYWLRSHKYGIKIPKSVKEALEIDAENGNNLWWEAILLEMKNVRPAFRKFEGNLADLVGYQKISCHMIFDVKLGENFRRKARYVGGGHTTEVPAALTYSSVVSRESVRIMLTLAALNEVDILCCDIQNAYLTAKCREKIYTVAGPEFGSEEGSIMIVEMALYGLKSSGAAFRSKLAGVLHDELDYRPSLADPDVWMRPATKPNGERYYEYVLCYVDDVMVISHKPMMTIDGIRQTFKLKGDKAESPDMYLGAQLMQSENDKGTKCWTLSSEKYLKAAIANVEDTLKGVNGKLPSHCPTPFSSGYHPAEDTSIELNDEGLKIYQEMIGVLRWAVEIGRLDILLEVSLLSSYLAMPRTGHLAQVYHIFGYLKHSPRRRLFMDPDHPEITESRFSKVDWTDFYRDAVEAIPKNAPEPLGRSVSTHCFVDASHGSDKVTRRSQTGVLIFLNRSPVMFYSKRQNSVEVSTFGAEFMALRCATEMVVSLRYKLRMFGVMIDEPTNMFCDNEAVFKNVTNPTSVLNKKQHSISYHYCREKVAEGVVRIAKEDTRTNLADVFTKCMSKSKREELLGNFMY